MKDHVSVFMLFVRSTIYRLALLMLLTAAVSAALLLLLGAPGAMSLESALAGSNIGIAFAAAFVLWTLQLCFAGCDMGAKSSYTLARLKISERAVYFVQMVHNLLSYILLWAFMTALCFGLCLLYSSVIAPIGSQDIMLCFYRDGLLHALLPMSEGVGWFKLAAAIPALAASSAAYRVGQKRGSRGGLGIAVCVALQLLTFTGAAGDLDGTGLASALACLGIAIVSAANILGGDGDDENA